MRDIFSYHKKNFKTKILLAPKVLNVQKKEVNKQIWNEGNGYRAAAAVESLCNANTPKKRFLLFEKEGDRENGMWPCECGILIVQKKQNPRKLFVRYYFLSLAIFKFFIRKQESVLRKFKNIHLQKN